MSMAIKSYRFDERRRRKHALAAGATIKENACHAHNTTCLLDSRESGGG
jgi:hypothetical protein